MKHYQHDPCISELSDHWQHLTQQLICLNHMNISGCYQMSLPHLVLRPRGQCMSLVRQLSVRSTALLTCRCQQLSNNYHQLKKIIHCTLKKKYSYEQVNNLYN